MIKSEKKRGKKEGISILGFLFLGFLLILVLSYFNISLKEVVESPTAQENINYVGDSGKGFWNVYFKKPASYLWNDIWVGIFWKSFVSNMERIRDNKPTDYEINSPSVDFSN